MVEFTRRAAASWAALALLGIWLVGSVGAEPGNDNRAPDLGDFDKLQAPEGNVVSFHAYAEGVQVWRWNGTSWVFVKPEAVLYAAREDGGIVGFHYEGPTWESSSGSYVVGTVIDRATPDSDSIPWLLLKKIECEGPGIFGRVTYIQRVNTVGGIAPADPGDVLGEEARVPYLADYYFYRKHD